MSSPNLVVVTGAAGRLGKPVANLLHEAGIRVLASDAQESSETKYEFRAANLLDAEAVTRLVIGADVVVHLGNHPGLKHPQKTFNENVTMNMNVFQAAAEQGVRKIIFASTLQLIGSHVDSRTVVNPPEPPEYPQSGSTTPRPANTNALSKTVSEQMLRYYVDRCGIDCVAIRYPIILDQASPCWTKPNEIDETIVREGFACIMVDDAARLILASIRTELPGFRIYAPGVSKRCRDTPLPELIRQYHPNLPSSMDNLVDNSVITKETGWSPSSEYTF